MNGAWPGGPCPQCGDEMPARLVHCRSCRAMLNSELTEDSIVIPDFFMLPEVTDLKSAASRGCYIPCPGCSEELRIHNKYRGQRVQCKHCNRPFVYGPQIPVHATYMPCPHCEQEIRAAVKYLGSKVACLHCSGHIELPLKP